MFKPLEDRVVIIRDEPIEKTAGDLILADSAKTKNTTGLVVAVGPGLLDAESGNRKPMNAQVGMRVMFPEYAGTEVKHEGQEYVVIGDGDILGEVF